MSHAWIQCFSGKAFDYLEPAPEQVTLDDIAHHLARQERYNGACKGRYSVARHCVILSHLVSDKLALAALMHDAREAYIPDFPRPMKHAYPELAKLIAKMEADVHKVIEDRFPVLKEFSQDDWEIISYFDTTVCHDERVHLLGPSERAWELPGEELGARSQWFEPCTSDMDADIDTWLFLDRAHELRLE